MQELRWTYGRTYRRRGSPLYVGAMTKFPTRLLPLAVSVGALGLLASAPIGAQPTRARAIGLAPGVFAPGPHNAITDVAGVRVGHATVSEGDSLRTGVTAIIPHSGDLFRSRVPAALHVGNGFGKLLGVTQLRELGELETPIALTCTLCIWQVGDALAGWMLRKPENAGVRSINPVVGETNDGGLNATRLRPGIGQAAVRALATADTGAVVEGSVGAGHGTVMFGWKGGIGTSSRKLPQSLGGYTIGVLVQGNYGGVLQMQGVPIGPLLGRYSFQRDIEGARRPGGGDTGGERGDGSCMIVIATDAPLLARNLERVAARALFGLARTGSNASNGSGDYVLAFSTSTLVRRHPDSSAVNVRELGNDAVSALFQAVAEATEEALYDAMLTATPVSSRAGRVLPLPVDSVRTLLRARGIGR
jgi:D-aminopeptidase